MSVVLTMRYLFNTTRIPTIPSDSTRVSDPATNNHIIVIRKNQFFTLDLQPNEKRLSTAEIKSQLDIIYLTATTLAPPVGALTTENRDVWTKAREALISHSRVNKASLETIETAAFVLCLDDSKPVTKDERNPDKFILDSVACWHGDGKNRFFDKSMQFIVFDNGKAGFNGERKFIF